MPPWPAKHDLKVFQGSALDKTYTWRRQGEAVNLTGYTGRLTISPNTVDPVILTLTTSNGGITLGGSAGTIRIKLSATQSALLRRSIYNLELIPGSGEADAFTLMYGNVVLTEEAG